MMNDRELSDDLIAFLDEKQMSRDFAESAERLAAFYTEYMLLMKPALPDEAKEWLSVADRFFNGAATFAERQSALDECGARLDQILIFDTRPRHPLHGTREEIIEYCTAHCLFLCLFRQNPKFHRSADFAGVTNTFLNEASVIEDHWEEAEALLRKQFRD